ncbi:MATE family efflux transporter [Desulfobaculum sp.]
MRNDDHLLTIRPVPELVRRIALPASIGFFFHTMFNITDTYFAGLLDTRALAALSLSFPVFFIIIAMGSGLQTGATALIGTAIGADNMKEARTLSRQALVFGLLVAGAITVVGIAASPLLFRTLGASGAYLDDCLAYMRPIFAGSVFFILTYMFNAVLNAVGDTKTFRNVLAAGSILNLALDPWFIYGGFGLPALGITGIALATVVIQAAGACYLGWRAWQTGLLDGCLRSGCKPQARPLAAIAHQGFPAAFNMVTVGLGIFIITYFIASFGKEAVAAYGIATRVEQIVLLPTIGLNVAVLSITAQNHGAGHFNRIRQTLRTVLLHGAWLMGIGAAVIFLGAHTLMGLFTDDAAVVAAGTQYLRIAAFVLYSYVVLYAHVACMQGLKRPMFAIWIGLFRQIFAPAAVFWLSIHVFDFGLAAIWWGIFGVTWSAALFALVYARTVLYGLPHTDNAPPPTA